MDSVIAPLVPPPLPKLDSTSETEMQAGLVRSHDISTQEGSDPAAQRPPPTKPASTPAYESPLRHQHRSHSAPRQVKESLNARSQYVTSHDDGTAQHRINQYIIKQEIGRGSFGAVHLAVDQYGTEYAVKEFSKSRLRKRAKSHILRKPKGQPKHNQPVAGGDFNSPLHRNPNGDSKSGQDGGGSIALIKQEIAIMKKLNHPNLCGLIEVLDDPREDSLYMVMEMCKKGIIMKVGLDQRCDPYDDESCRCWFRDLILGIEYLHAQGIVHRDIKPDNCLLTNDDVLKVVDFGVSEMFEKRSEMLTTKSAGSPAFLPPELCVIKHGDISGKSADIWSMGVTLYCLKYGHIPFERSSIMELYEAIKADPPGDEVEKDADFKDLINRILQKDPKKRIKMPELREHPWVTKQGSDPLLSEAENTADLIEPPTAAEMEDAITGNVDNLMTVMKAVNKFKKSVAYKRPPIMSSILGEGNSPRFSQPPLAMRGNDIAPALTRKSQSLDSFDRQAVEGSLAAEGVHGGMNVMVQGDSARGSQVSLPHRSGVRSDEEASNEKERFLGFRPAHLHGHEQARSYDETGRRGHAHDPLQDHLYLYIGPSTFSGASSNADRRATFAPGGYDEDVPIVSESPGAADIDIYETAYTEEIERIRQRCKEEGKDEEESIVYTTRRVDARLLAISQLAGRFMAYGEEGLDRVGTATGFKDRKARVTEVSRALRAAAREEYEKRRIERRQKEREAAGQVGADKPGAESDATRGDQPEPKPRQASDGQARESSIMQSWTPSLLSQTALAGKAAEKSRQAKDSLRNLMAMRKDRGSASKGGKESS